MVNFSSKPAKLSILASLTAVVLVGAASTSIPTGSASPSRDMILSHISPKDGQ